MSKIRPFRAIRPAQGKAQQIAELPYDVYNRAEAKAAAGDNSISFLRIDRPEMNFPDDTDMYSDKVYDKARQLLWDMVANGDFVQDDENNYYIYELTMDGRVQTGIVGAASIDDYDNGIIKRHENTRREKEEDRVRHVDTCNAQTGPIFLAYRNNAIITGIVNKTKSNKPLFDFTSEDGVRHRGFIVDDRADVSKIEEAFANIDSIYIADGHHRCASAVRVGHMRRDANPEYSGDEEFNYFLSVLFPDEELKILDYNRVIKDLGGHTREDILNHIKGLASVNEEGSAVSPNAKAQFGFYMEGQWYRCKFNDDLISDDPVKSLDVSLLQDLVLEPLFGITDPKSDNRIDFVGGIRGLKELEDRCEKDAKCAFSMYPTDISELFDVSDAGLLMPPKSTWFEPKLRSGLFIHEI